MRMLWGVLLVLGAQAQAPVRARPFRLEELKTPPGFEVSVYARVAGEPRLMTFGPNGVLYVAARGAGAVVTIPSENRTVPVLTGLNGPHSVSFRENTLYVATNDAVLRFRDAVTDDLVIRGAGEKLISLPTGGQHSSRTAAPGPDGRLYVTAGSTCNFCVESDSRRAAMLRFEADGSGESIYARGLRNAVSFAWHPATGELWALENGGDGLGDDEPPEEINILRQGGDYGWPDCVGRSRGIDWGARAQPGRCSATLAPELEMQAHSAPLGIAFYNGTQYPAAFLNDVFVSFHGSWNRNEPTGYKVVRVRASSGRAAGVEDFLWGFLDPKARTQSGRPVGVAVGPDGAVYVSDDDTGNIYRIRYVGPRINPGGLVDRGGNIFELYGGNLDNVAVTANGIPAAILYSGATQVNFALPDGLAGDITITVQNDRASDQIVLPGR